MTMAYQPSMFDLDDVPSLRPLAGHVRRTELSDGAWVDHRPDWLNGSDALLNCLVDEVPWRSERRPMYDRMLDVPRLVRWYSATEPWPHPVLRTALDQLSLHYRDELGEPFMTAGMCLYRDGRDSVAWHGDTIGRGAASDTMVAILSVGTARPLLLRPRSGGASRRFSVGHGDLVVMGGSCQRTWEHSIPKSARPVGPRVSIQFRPAGVA